MLDALILDQLERLAAKSSAIQGTTFDYSNLSNPFTAGTVGQFMANTDGSDLASVTNGIFGLHSNQGYMSYGANANYQVPYYAPVGKRWWFVRAAGLNGAVGASCYSFDPATNTFISEDTTKGLMYIVEDPAGNVWATSSVSGFQGVWRRTAAATWTQVYSGTMSPWSCNVWHDGTPYFLTSDSTWLTPSGSVLVTTVNPGIAAGSPSWYQLFETPYSRTGLSLVGGTGTKSGIARAVGMVSNPNAAGAWRGGISKVGTWQRLAMLPAEAAEIYARMPSLHSYYAFNGNYPISIAPDAIGVAYWVPVAETPYYLHIVGYERVASQGEYGSYVHEGRAYFHISIVNIQTGGSQYLGMIDRPPLLPPAKAGGWVNAATPFAFFHPAYTYANAKQTPLAAKIQSGLLKIYFSTLLNSIDVTGNASNGNGDWALMTANLDARIAI